ncbi:hypothetical protein [Anabaena azotica]|uniref:Uncharacterized protein n=1 Tax=Anabaena azotica FACHB-119 TaxID=947527 RepID=A0ABR8D1D3_9NOST|nr:hypothetical protein [Anabaena azotica]MBD2500994.1 hypothetical protein [Anabaena azotica FACHB-119]
MSIYSNQAIRWDIGTFKNFNSIVTWWKNQNNQKFKIYHVTEYKRVFNENTLQVAWEPVKYNEKENKIVINPNLELNNGWASLTYNGEESINAHSIDLDMERDNLFVWFGEPQQVIIFVKDKH